MRKFVIFFTECWVLLMFIFGCQDITIGYLLVDDARYVPDSLVVKRVLDAGFVEMEVRNEDYYDEELREYYMEYINGTLEELLALCEQLGIYPTITVREEGDDAKRAK